MGGCNAYKLDNGLDGAIPYVDTDVCLGGFAHFRINLRNKIAGWHFSTLNS